IDIVADAYGVTPKEIEELTDLIDKYYRGSREEQREAYDEFQKKLGDMLIRYYQNKGKLNEYEQFVLVSDIYNSGISSASDILKTVDVDNNMFNDYIIIKVRDFEYGHYNLYFDPKTHENMTEEVYQEKLIKLFETKGSNLDYSDPDCRFLVYLYILSYKDKLFMETKSELFTSKTPEELANYITRSIFNIYDDVKMDPEFLYGYLSGGKVNFNEMFREVYSFSGDTLSVSLLIEYLRCLKHEMLDGNLSEEAYKEQFEKLTDDFYYPETEAIVESAVDNDESTLSDFSLPIFSIEYSNGEIQKYTYKTSDY
ncbi:MAG: hypothetical protein K2L98_02425, partial [Bacilli bacterium]|nr:hypothetical protein [Bacilli bacterium]